MHCRLQNVVSYRRAVAHKPDWPKRRRRENLLYFRYAGTGRRRVPAPRVRERTSSAEILL